MTRPLSNTFKFGLIITSYNPQTTTISCNCEQFKKENCSHVKEAALVLKSEGKIVKVKKRSPIITSFPPGRTEFQKVLMQLGK